MNAGPASTPAGCAGFSHSVIGAVHSVRPGDRPGAVREAVDHEIRACESVRVVIDLTERRHLDDDDVHIILETVEHRPTHEDWRIIVDPDRGRDLAEALEAAGWGDVVDLGTEQG